MSNGFERRKEQSKEEIRRAARELFAQFGVERVSMADIARKAGVSQATIYNNFASKETLAREFAETAVAGLAAGIERALAPEMSFAEKMTALTHFIAEMIASGSPPEAGRSVFAGSADLQADPEIRRILDAAREKMTGVMLRLAAEGRAEGAVDPGLSDEALALYFRAFMDVFTNPRLQRGYASREGLVGELGRLMVYGLSGLRNGRM